ncbi:MAG: isopentenyl phosphate kinase [Chloroflexota bacterium]|nr:isopentenyl phosphate kinase [Chloroflexota bacterium]
MDDLLFLKLGGSILTDKTRPEALDEAVLALTARSLAEALRARPGLRLLIGHGGGSFGHHWAHRYQTHLGVHDPQGWEGVARVADAMGRLNRAVVRHLIDAGINAISVQPSASAVAAHGTLQSMATNTLSAMLNSGLVPVLYGDVVVDVRQGATIISTEAIFAFLAPVLRPQRIILVGEDGVYTSDPRRDPQARRIPIIDESNIEQVLDQAKGSHGVDVTGGMLSKVQTMWRLVASRDDLEVQLVGPDPAVVGSVLRGDMAAGTLIRRRPADGS